MDVTGKPFEASDRKKNRKKILELAQKTIERKSSQSNKLTFSLQTLRIKLNKTWKQSIQIKTVGTLQD